MNPLNKDTTCYFPNGVLIIEVPLCRTVYCGPNGVLIIEVPLYRTAYCGPNGVLIIEVPLYRTAYCGSNGVLIIEVPLYRTAYCGPNGVLITEVSLYICEHGRGHLKSPLKTPQHYSHDLRSQRFVAMIVMSVTIYVMKYYTWLLPPVYV